MSRDDLEELERSAELSKQPARVASFDRKVLEFDNLYGEDYFFLRSLARFFPPFGPVPDVGGRLVAGLGAAFFSAGTFGGIVVFGDDIWMMSMLVLFSDLIS